MLIPARIAECIYHRRVAVEACTRIGKGERLPLTSETAVPCFQCKNVPAPPLSYPVVHSLNMGSPGGITIQHGCGHRSACILGLKNEIVLNVHTSSATEPQIQKVIAKQKPSVFQRLRLCHFEKQPEGYFSAEKMIALGLYSLVTSPIHFKTDPIGYLLEQMARNDPICLWVHQHIAEAAVNSDPPSLALDMVQWHHHRNVFFLPPGTLQLNGHDCPFLAYSVIETGSYSLMDIPNIHLNLGKRLLVWTASPTTGATYTWNLLLRDNLCEHTYLSRGTTKKASPEQAEFMERAIKLILVLNTLALTPQATEEPMKCVKIKPLSKQSRKNGRIGSHKTYTCPLFQFTRSPARKRKYKKTGRTMPPHNKPGWFQIIHTKTGSYYLYRPPHRANSHLDPE